MRTLQNIRCDAQELTSLLLSPSRLFKDAIHMEMSEQGEGSFSNIIAPCTGDQLFDMIGALDKIQRHPFMQVRETSF